MLEDPGRRKRIHMLTTKTPLFVESEPLVSPRFLDFWISIRNARSGVAHEATMMWQTGGEWGS